MSFGPDTSDTISDLLEIDPPTIPQADDTAPDELAIEMDPGEPMWLVEARRAMGVAESHAALNVVVARYSKLPEDRKVLIRPILADNRARVDRLAAKPTPARGVAVMAATATIAASANVDAEDAAAMTAAAAQAAGLPVQLVASGSGGVMHTVTAQVSQPHEPASAGQLDGGPITARWREIKVAGPYQGQWGVAVEHTQRGVSIDPPREGDFVLVYRAHGGSAQVKRIAAVVQNTPSTRMQRGFSLCAVADAPPGTRATIARAPQAQAPATNHAWANEILVETTIAETGEHWRLRRDQAGQLHLESISAVSYSRGLDWAYATQVADERIGSNASPQARTFVLRDAITRYLTPATDLTADLSAIASEGATNAAVADLRHVQAHMTAAEIAALPPANDASAALPVGPGIIHTPTGKNYADMTPAERKGLSRVGKAAEAKLSGAALMRRGDVIAGAVASGAGGMFGWEGAGAIKRGKLVDALATIGRGDDAPATKDAQVQLSRAVRTLNSGQHIVHTVRGDDLPDGIAVRYVVIDRGSMPDGTELTASVNILLTVDMREDGTIQHTGSSTLADLVRSDYAARTADQTLTSADLTAWLQGILTTRHGSTGYGRHWYVPGGQRDAAIALTRAVASSGWGRRWIHGITLTTEEALIEGLADSLMDEIDLVQHKWTKAREDAKAAYATVDEAGKRKRQTEDLTSRGAAAYLRELTIVSERVKGYAGLLGDAALEKHRAKIAKLDAEIRLLCDDTTIRGAMLEFS